VIGLMWSIGLALAIDVNDQLSLQLDGGETIEGWFVRAGPDHVFIHIPTTGDTSRIPLNMVHRVEVNGGLVESGTFGEEVKAAHEAWQRWRSDPPPHPPASIVATSSLLLAGSGHAMLGDWGLAPGLLFADSVGMGVVAWEMGHQQRLNVLLGASVVSIVMKTYGATNSARAAKARRRKFGIKTDR